MPTANFASLVYGPAGVALDDPAETLHEASRLYPRLAPARLEVHEALARGGEPARSVARSSRTHDHRPGVELPAPTPLRGRLDDVIARRRSERREGLRPLRLDELAAVLSASYAVGPRGPGESRRPVPSAGALYPLELYVIALAISGLEPGVYHYQPFRNGLSHLGPVCRAELRGALVDPSLVDGAAAILVVTALFWRSRFKYGLRGYRFALLEAGHLVQNALLASSDLDLPALPVGGFYDRRLDAVVGADGLDQACLYALVLGGSR
jgi:SagB-type dehydrogenase family enzyme